MLTRRRPQSASHLSICLLLGLLALAINGAARANAEQIVIESAAHHLGDNTGNEGTVFQKDFVLTGVAQDAKLDFDFVAGYGPNYENPPVVFINGVSAGSVKPFFPPLDTTSSLWQSNADGSHDYNGAFHVSLPVAALLRVGANTFKIQNGVPADDYRFNNVAVNQGGSAYNLWDYRRGSTVTATSGAVGSFPISNLFGGYSGAVEAGNTLFQDGKPAGFTHFVEWQTQNPIVLRGFRLYANHDGSDNHYYRAMRVFNLYAADATGRFQRVYTFTPTSPYTYVGGAFNLLVNARITPVVAQKFRAEFIQNDPLGPRVAELEAIATPVPRLVHRYPFDTDASDVVGGANGTLQGGATVSGGSLLLDGASGYAALPAGIVSNLTGATFEAWVNWTPNGYWARIFDFGNSTASYLFLTPNAGTARFAIRSNSSVAEQIVNGTTFPSSTLTHVAVTIDPVTSAAKLYLNGAFVAQNTAVTLTPAALGQTVNNWLGRSQYADPYFRGAISEFRVYDGALTDADIKNSFLRGADSPTGYTTFTFAQAAETGTPAPGGGTYTYFYTGSPGLSDDGSAAFTAATTAYPNAGIFTASASGPGRVAAAYGLPSPDGGTYTGFNLNPKINTKGSVLFNAATTLGQGGGYYGHVVSTPTGQYPVVYWNMTAFDGNTLRGTGATAGLNNKDQVAFQTWWVQFPQQNLYTFLGIRNGSDPNYGTIAGSNFLYPAGGQSYPNTDIGLSLSDSGFAAFYDDVHFNNYTVTKAAVSIATPYAPPNPLNAAYIALEGQSTPIGGTFAAFGKGNLPTDGGFARGLNNGAPAINSKNEVAFWAAVTGGSAPHGLFLRTASGIVAVALGGQDAPGGGAFNQFAGPAIASINGVPQVAFYANLSGNPASTAGIFLYRSGYLSRVIGAGDALYGSTVTALAFVTGHNQKGQIAFLYSLADGRGGVAIASPIPLAISGMTASPVLSDRATISWTTNFPAGGIVGYGITPQLGSQILDSAFKTAHSINLTGLTPNTLYYYLVGANDGNGFIYQQGTFVTAKGGTPLLQVANYALTRSGTEIVAALTLTNTGTATASKIVLTSATLNTTAGNGLPLSVADIGAGGSLLVPGGVHFAAAGLPSGTKTVLRITGTYNGGSFTASYRVTLP